MKPGGKRSRGRGVNGFTTRWGNFSSSTRRGRGANETPARGSTSQRRRDQVLGKVQVPGQVQVRAVQARAVQPQPGAATRSPTAVPMSQPRVLGCKRRPPEAQLPARGLLCLRQTGSHALSSVAEVRTPRYKHSMSYHLNQFGRLTSTNPATRLWKLPCVAVRNDCTA